MSRGLGDVYKRQNNVDIKQVIQWMSEQTKKNFIVDPRVKGRVNVYSNQLMTLAEAYQVFLTMLDVYGFAAVQSGNNIKILPNAQARSAGLPIIESSVTRKLIILS